jgi:hypothetical protein
MTDDHYRPADDGGVLSVAIAAVMLIMAGLALMVLENYQADRQSAVTVSTLQQR